MRTQSIIALVTAFSFIISTLNLYVFWTPFGINIFDHLTTSEILVRSIKPLFLGIGVLLMTAFMQVHDEELRPAIDEVHEKKTLIDKATHCVMSTFGFQTLFIGIAAHYKLETNFHILMYSLAGLVLSIQLLIKIGTYQKIIKTYGIPRNGINLSAILIVMTVSSAYMNAENIKDRISYTRAEITLKEKDTKIRKIYIGETANTLFFYSFESDEVLEINRSEILKIIKSESSCKECRFDIEKTKV